MTQSLMTGVIYYLSMGSDSSEPEVKEASSNKKKFVHAIGQYVREASASWRQ